MFELRLDLADNAELTTKDIPDFGNKLLAELPTLREHRCWSGETGGFLKEVELGTDLAHVIEHIILEIQHLADPEHRIYSGWTKCAPEDKGHKNRRVFTIHFQTRSFEIGSSAAKQAVRIVSNVIRGADPSIPAALQELRAYSW